MILRPSADGVLWERIESLLRATSDMLGAHIEIHTPMTPLHARSALGLDSPTCCAACRRSDVALYEQCASQRNSDPDGVGRESLHWVCPHKCEITIVPIRVPEFPDAQLVSIRPQPAQGMPHQPDRPEALRFLTQLSSLLSEHLSMTDELSSVSGELTHRHDEL